MMGIKTYMFVGNQYAKKYMNDAKDAMRTLSAKLPKAAIVKKSLADKGSKIQKHIKSHPIKYTAGASSLATAGVFSQHQKHKKDGTHAKLKKELKRKGYV